MDLTVFTGNGMATLIDCSDGAIMPAGMTWLKKIKYHRRHGRLLWDGQNLDEFSSEMFIFVDWNVNVLYWLLSNRGQIPSWLKGKYLILGGTCFLNQDEEGVFLSLFWNKYQNDWFILPYPENWKEEMNRIKKTKATKIRLVHSQLTREQNNANAREKSCKKNTDRLKLVRSNLVE